MYTRLISSLKTTTPLLSIALVCALMFGVVSPAQHAHADVRKADVVLGETIESRGLSIAQCPNIDAEYAVVMDEDGTIFFERNAQTPTTIASITKIMTALVALEHGDLEQMVTVSAKAAQIGESSAELREGDRLTLEHALYALMVPSGNDAALAIAQAVGIGLMQEQGADEDIITEDIAVDAFVKEMNKKAAELGMDNTLFTNPHGLDDGEYASDQQSCAYDVALMSRTAMNNTLFREIVANENAKIEVVHGDSTHEQLELESTNELLGEGGLCGIKTGFTDSAGASLAGAAASEQGDVYAIVLNSPTSEQRFGDASELVQWIKQHYVDYPLANSAESTTVETDENHFDQEAVPVVAEVAHTNWIDRTVKATLADPEQHIKVFDLNGNIAQTVEYDEVTGDINPGDKVGTLTFTQRNEVVAVVDMVACESVAGPSFLEGIGIWWQRLFNNFSGTANVADSILINTTPLINDKTL